MLAQDMIHLEQYMDFLRNRMFRQSLLVHKNATPNYQLKWEQLKAFHVGSPARFKQGSGVGGQGSADSRPLAPREASDSRSESGTMDSTEAMTFATPEGITLQSREPIVKAAMMVLSEIWPRNMLFGDLVRAARKRLTTDGTDQTDKKKETEAEDDKALGQAILSFYASASTSLVELWLEPPKFAGVVGDRPVASPLARHQAKSRNRVTNVRHESVFLGDFERQLLQRLDGTRDRDALKTELAELVRRGELTVEKDGKPLSDDAALKAALGEAIEQQLGVMSRSALLEAA